MDIAEAWVNHRKKNNLEISLDRFMEWMENLNYYLESGFEQVYEDEFGSDEEDEDDED
jgi:hypothetical protein